VDVPETGPVNVSVFQGEVIRPAIIDSNYAA